MFGFLAKSMGASSNPRVYGQLITAAVTFGYLGSNIFYYKAGRAYKAFMEERDSNKWASEQRAQLATAQ